jgi:hypothetical protein
MPGSKNGFTITFDEFRTILIEDGIEAARKDYTDPKDLARLNGSIAGFQACFNKNPPEIRKLLKDSAERTSKAFIDVNEKTITDYDYWYQVCFAAEVEWVANCISALMISQGLNPIAGITTRGVMKASEIVHRIKRGE